MLCTDRAIAIGEVNSVIQVAAVFRLAFFRRYIEMCSVVDFGVFTMENVKQTISKAITVTVDTDITTNDVFNWLCACNDAETLHYLGKAALNRARAIENPDDDVFHSL